MNESNFGNFLACHAWCHVDDVVKSVKDVVHTRSCENRAVDCTVLSVQHSIAIQDESESSTVVQVNRPMGQKGHIREVTSTEGQRSLGNDQFCPDPNPKLF